MPAAAPPEITRRKLERFLSALRPDNLTAAADTIATDGQGAFLGIFNPADPAASHGCSAYAGWLAAKGPWWQSGAPAPDGTFALFRCDADSLEVLADFSASRTIWFAKTDELFVASTSQRAVAWFTARFEPNARAISWMLASGSLGPGESWDSRSRALGPGGRARLDRKSWELEIVEPPVVFQADPVDASVHGARLQKAMEETFTAAQFDWSRWVLPLSGGNDSRAILLWLPDRTGLRTVTWGSRQALQSSDSDAFIAQKIAEHLDLPHRYYVLDQSDEPPQRVFDRFILAGEGRVDHLSGYTDGFQLWSELAKSGIGGIVRGDHPFGHRTISNAQEARFRTGLMLWSDFSALPTLAQLGLEHLPEQQIPPHLTLLAQESAEDWRDRLYQAFRTPVVFAALNELKSTYVEIANPLLLRRFVELARSHPAQLRTGKKLFKEIAAQKTLPIPFAHTNAITELDAALGQSRMSELLLDEISSRSATDILSPQLAAFVSDNMSQTTGQRLALTHKAVLRRAKRWLPSGLREQLKRKPDYRSLPVRQLALRAYLIVKMHERLQADARAGS